MSSTPSQFDGESLITPALLAASRSAEPQVGNLVEFDHLADALAMLSLFELRIRGTSNMGAVIADLAQHLHRLKHSISTYSWAQMVPELRNHSISTLLQQDPFTDWSFRKPRGYSGDAHLLDFIYQHPNVQELVAKATSTGAAIYDYTKDAPSSEAVRERREILAKLVDDITAARTRDSEVLTLAAGHLREAAMSEAFIENRVRRWVALDQDPFSVAVIAQQYADTAVEPFEGSVKGYLTGAYDLGTFDLVYAAGLYDYLPRAVAIKLTRQCLASLKSGGTFLFANFATDLVQDAYMEVFMNWELLLRTEAEMWDVINMCVDRNEVSADVFRGDNGVILYGMIRKA